MGHDAELDALRAGVSCAVLLERHPPPWRLDRQESTRRCLKYRRGAGEIILVTHAGRGWWDPRSAAKGDVFSLVQHLEPGLSLGHVREVLRPLAGLSPSFPEHLRKTDRAKPAIAFDVRWARRGPPGRGSPCWRYLTGERGLPEPVVEAAMRAGVLREGPYGSAWFAHHDHAGRLTGFEMRGPDFRGFSENGEKTLFRLPGRLETSGAPVRRLVVAEAPIDAMSLAAIERLRADSLYVATTGGMGPGTVAALDHTLRALSALPGAVLVAATDADRAGDGYASRLQAIGDAAGVRFERLRPPVEGEDWNDRVRQGSMRPDRAWMRLQSGKQREEP